MKKFEEAFISVMSLFIVIVIAAPIVVIGFMRLAEEAAKVIS